MEETEVVYSLPRVLRLVTAVANGERGTDELADVERALRRLPIVHRACLLLRARGDSRRDIARQVLGGQYPEYLSAARDFLEVAEVRLLFELNGEDAEC